MMRYLLLTCLCLVSLLTVVSSEDDPIAVKIQTKCNERISKANLPPVVTSSYCCIGIIRCFCFEALCKSETVKPTFCNVTFKVECGSVGIGSRCKEALKDFPAFCAGANASCATGDDVKPYVSSTTVTIIGTGHSISVGLIIGIFVGTALFLIITIAFIYIFCCVRDSKPLKSTSSASKSSVDVIPKQKPPQSLIKSSQQ